MPKRYIQVEMWNKIQYMWVWSSREKSRLETEIYESPASWQHLKSWGWMASVSEGAKKEMRSQNSALGDSKSRWPRDDPSMSRMLGQESKTDRLRQWDSVGACAESLHRTGTGEPMVDQEWEEIEEQRWETSLGLSQVNENSLKLYVALPVPVRPAYSWFSPSICLWACLFCLQ